MFVIVMRAFLGRGLGVLPRFVFEIFRKEDRHQPPHHADQNERADHFRENKLPAHQQPEHGAELNHKIGGSKHECECGNQRSALLKRASPGSDGRIGTR